MSDEAKWLTDLDAIGGRESTARRLREAWFIYLVTRIPVHERQAITQAILDGTTPTEYADARARGATT